MNGITLASDRPDLARLEFVKWAAFVAMVCDHVDLALFDRSVPWLHLVGGFAFPAFCLCFGVGLARTSDPVRVAGRLILPSVLAQVAWFWIDQAHPVNVLAMFALCAVAVRVAWFGPIVLGLAAFMGEGGLFLPALVAAGFYGARVGSTVPLAVAGASWGVLAASPGAFVAAAAVAWLPGRLPVLPRVPGLLAWGYTAHLAVLAAAASA
jgi:hypothetical protein